MNPYCGTQSPGLAVNLARLSLPCKLSKRDWSVPLRSGQSFTVSEEIKLDAVHTSWLDSVHITNDGTDIGDGIRNRGEEEELISPSSCEVVLLSLIDAYECSVNIHPSGRIIYRVAQKNCTILKLHPPPQKKKEKKERTSDVVKFWTKRCKLK